MACRGKSKLGFKGSGNEGKRVILVVSKVRRCTDFDNHEAGAAAIGTLEIDGPLVVRDVKARDT